MKKYILVLMAAMICASTMNFACAKTTTSNSALANAIRLYKAGNYSQSYTAFNNIVKKDPSNAVAYYYLAMTSAQIGKKEEAVANYEKVISLSPNGQLGRYATKGKTCLETPDKCHEESEQSADDRFIQSRFGSGFSDKARSEYEKQKIENLMREMNRGNDVTPQKFRDYKDFSSEVPTNDEIVAALRVLQRAGLSDVLNNNVNEMSLLTGNNETNSNNAMLNMLMGSGNSSLSPQVIQSLLTNQMSVGF